MHKKGRVKGEKNEYKWSILFISDPLSTGKFLILTYSFSTFRCIVKYPCQTINDINFELFIKTGFLSNKKALLKTVK